MRALSSFVLLVLLNTFLIGSAEAATASDDFARVRSERTVQSLNTKAGFQIYTCVNEKWMPHAAEATLVNEHGQIVGRHLFVASPSDSAKLVPSWQLDDGSSITGKKLASQPNPKGVDLLVLKVETNSGKGSLAAVTDIERMDIVGGLAPADSCQASAALLRVPYEARYIFASAK